MDCGETGKGDLNGDEEELWRFEEAGNGEGGGGGRRRRPAHTVWQDRWYIFTCLCFSPSLCFFFFFFFAFLI